MTETSGMMRNLTLKTRRVSEKEGHIFKEIPPSTAPRIKFAIGTVAVPVSSMALPTTLGIK